MRAATETVDGAGRRFSSQVSEAALVWEGSLIAAVNQAWERMQEPVLEIQKLLRPLIWVGGSVGALVGVDLMVRWLK